MKLPESQFKVIPAGEHSFKIEDVEYKEDFGKLQIHMITAKGYKHTERFTLLNNNGEINNGAYNAFAFFARTAFDNFSLDEIEPKDLIGLYIKATVVHSVLPNRNDPSKMVTFANLSDKYPSNYVEWSGGQVATKITAEPIKASSPTASGAKAKVNLDDLLG